ncbi:DJ-1/YajL/PfpI superfamily, includes chaperone protein YajL (former ThiJ), parkinsonism-associated protein DJ-1, peptidases PfpI, Hsp31 [Porphyromonas crevioricanis JCM 15906]|uniref:DJ-1/YajL/PfpI superfamily, includes chaperone protein YajL (Former ThiJ), parkinsonism-associated protein DJ-1, peptidases PfpI, Hsp31 n=1 Tax=Porphyromonas crevioricanis JCM 15906 TaxID=1305617 RepID=T1CNJ2_9PORP|nr:DJ-1 family glyoxalase III [Porphyromonas crevioricanis]GAD04663.1 DJ-1/YajL/PfpI superfamily, includes chaperone protein YajL (former ThiJ), parkinsonism-associated protein DJ-1, peptidases PfpI, Hsp31 [Porphyromonas crevioricanis JCM 15906]SJZ66922.1 4-methyl-5(b-hydroxyethyl)-thiazole monophosphate biosynthesis [Porphyromonas crevioricanis]
MNQVFVFLANGFEEIEALSVIDILRRAELPVCTVSVHADRKVIGAHEVAVEADTLINDVTLDDAACLVLPGGMPGAANLMDCVKLREALVRQHEAGRLLAAICAAPMVLGALGISKGREMTCYPGFEERLIDARISTQGVAEDGHVITGKGPAFAASFALAIVKRLAGEARAKEVASGMLFQ